MTDSLVRQMGYVVVITPDVEESATDLASIVGLRMTSRSPDRILMSSNTRACEVAFVPGAKSAIRAVGLEVADGAAVDEIARRAASDGCRILDDKPSLDIVDRAVRFATPFGPVFEIHTPVPREKPQPINAPNTHSKRLDHANLRVNDTRAFHDFATKTIGMQLSDRTEDYSRAWYRCGDGFHHTLAAGQGNGLHHYGFDAHSLLDLAAVADNLVLQGRSLLWGVGRHGPGNNIFSYYLDPNGCVIETSFGMERIDDIRRQAGIWSDAALLKMFDVWGSMPPSNYAGALTPFSD